MWITSPAKAEGERVSFANSGLDEIAVYPRRLTADETRKNHRTATGAGVKS